MRDYSWSVDKQHEVRQDIDAGRGDSDLRCWRREPLSIIPADQITRRGQVRIGFTPHLHIPAYGLLTLEVA